MNLMSNSETLEAAKTENIDNQMNKLVKRKKHLAVRKKANIKRKNYLKKLFSKRGQKGHKTEDKIKYIDRKEKEKAEYEIDKQNFVIIKETKTNSC